MPKSSPIGDEDMTKQKTIWVVNYAKVCRELWTFRAFDSEAEAKKFNDSICKKCVWTEVRKFG